MRWLPGAAAPASAASSSAWQPLLQTSTLTLGRYRLAVGAVDPQQPHEQDEVYSVLSGKAKLSAGDSTRDVQAGDVVFVARRVAHRFHDVTEDLDVLVFFSTARPASGGMAGRPRPTEQTPYPESSQRGNARVFYWFGPGSAGQLAIDHGQPRWQPSLAKWLDQPDGTRWRLGENFWTTLDTNLPLELGGVGVGVGQYYAVLQNTAEHGVELVLLDPQAIRERRLDAYQANATEGGLRIPLTLERLDAPAPRLRIELSIDEGSKDRGALRIEFGPYRLAAPLLLKPAR